MSKNRKIIFIGGGAAGFFGALRAAEVAKEQQLPVEISILESSTSFLKKVRISGGGRCNVTHNCFDVRAFCQNYPRGSRELISPMQSFQARDTVEWFKERGISIVAEADGRMFPSTDLSQTIIDCYLGEAERLGINLLTQHSVQSINTKGDQFEIELKDRASLLVDRVMVATGSSPGGYKFAQSLGHTITGMAPSLFSFKIKDALLSELSGLSFPQAHLKLKTKSKLFKQQGPILITHWGLSGPAILKLSAWAAREMKAVDYKAELTVNWLGVERQEQVLERLKALKEREPKKQIKNCSFNEIPKSFWESLLASVRIPQDLKWADLAKKQINQMAEKIYSSRFEILGKNRFKDEFVECGGVKLSEIDFKTMQSKLTPGLYFAGEVLDIDGITGGFNFQNAWTTSWIGGGDMAKADN